MQITDSLKAIRKQLGLSLRSMAEALDMPLSSYSHYENPNLFKDTFLPMRLALKIAKVVRERGGDPSAVMMLAGVATPGSELDARLADLMAALPESEKAPLEVYLRALVERHSRKSET